MTQTATATFDGQQLNPDRPLILKANQRYIITVQEIPTSFDHENSAWDVLTSLVGSVDAPEDWAAEHDHYLHGAPKRQKD